MAPPHQTPVPAVLPPRPRSRSRAGRRHSTVTNLGKILANKGWRVKQLSDQSGINERQLSEYLSGRKDISAKHRIKLAEVLGVPAGKL